MKLLRYGPPGQERPGLLDADGKLRDLGGKLRELGATPAFAKFTACADGGEFVHFADDAEFVELTDFTDLAGAALDPQRLAALASIDPAGLPEVIGPVRLGPCVGRVGKIVCVGLNYRSLAIANGLALPSEPVIFLKAASALCGPDDPLVLPPGTAAVDWEVELAVVIGRRAQRVTRQDALAHVAGYCVINDLSARDWQFGPDCRPPSAGGLAVAGGDDAGSEVGGNTGRDLGRNPGVSSPPHNGGQWDCGKNHDGFAPLGPWLVTADEMAASPKLKLWLDVDGERLQDADSGDLLFELPDLIAHISRYMTLHPGDVIATGTPPGSGFLRQPPRYLAAGQTLRAGIDGLGTQTRRVVAEEI